MRVASVFTALAVEPGFAVAARRDWRLQRDFSHSILKIGAALGNHDLIHNAEDRRGGTGIIKRHTIDGKAHIRNRSAF